MRTHRILKLPHYVQLYASLWNNPDICIGKAPVFWKQWHSSGILTQGGLYKDVIFMSFADLVHDCNLEGKDHFWKHLQIRSCVTSRVKLGEFAVNCILDYLNMMQECHMASQLYKLISCCVSGELSNVKLLWQKELRSDFTQDRRLNILSDCGKYIKEARGKFIHYKIIHKYYHITSRLHRMKRMKDNFCWKCKTEVETFLHCIWECFLDAPFWGGVVGVLSGWFGSTIPLNKDLCLLSDKSQIPNIFGI